MTCALVGARIAFGKSCEDPSEPICMYCSRCFLDAIRYAMAKKASRKRSFRLRRVRLTPELGLSTLGSDTAIVGSAVGSSTAQYRVKSLKGTWSIVGLTAGEGPVTIGIAHSDYSVTEIKECLEAAASISPGDKIAQEQANRLVRIVGTLDGGRTTLNDGRPVSTKLNWLITIGQGFNLFAYNEDQASLTTGATVTFSGDAWVQDS